MKNTTLLLLLITQSLISQIKYVESEDAFKIWIESKDKKEVILWKSFLNMPVSVEYNINF